MREVSPRLAQAGHPRSLPTPHCGFGSSAPAQVTDARLSRSPFLERCGRRGAERPPCQRSERLGTVRSGGASVRPTRHVAPRGGPPTGRTGAPLPLRRSICAAPWEGPGPALRTSRAPDGHATKIRRGSADQGPGRDQEPWSKRKPESSLCRVAELPVRHGNRGGRVCTRRARQVLFPGACAATAPVDARKWRAQALRPRRPLWRSTTAHRHRTSAPHMLCLVL
jgi:hypothetical protein